jgi:hypothetical protein
MNFDGADSTCTYYIDEVGTTSIGVGGVMTNDGRPMMPSPMTSGQATNVASFFHTEQSGSAAYGSIVDDIGVCDATNGYLAVGERCDASAVPTPTATPTYFPDWDGDGVANAVDNCSRHANVLQDDTDNDDCGNICDADYDQSGTAGFPDFGEFLLAFGGTDQEYQHLEPIRDGDIVGYPDFGQFVLFWGNTTGPSGTTSGTTACP